MSDRPEVLTRPLTRQKLAAVLGEKPEQIRAFEAMLEDISRVLPDAAQATNKRTTTLELVVGAFNGITLQQAIDAAFAAGGGIVKPLPKVHVLTEQLRLKSRVILDLSAGATLRRGFNTSATGAGLIGIEAGTDMAIRGGTLDGNGATFSQSFNIVGGTDVRGLAIEGVTFLSVVDFHAVDLADCEDVVIRDCRFLGFWNKSGSRQFSEAIQLDPGISAGGTINRNISVSGCTFGGPLDAALVDFDPWPCAMGNHSGFNGLYHRDIRFTDNSVNGASWAGVNLLNMRDVVVSGNTFTDCLHGVRLRLKDDVAPAQACRSVSITGNTFKGVSQAGVKFASPTLANVPNIDTGRHTDITISGNTSDSGYALAQLCWASRVTVAGNTHTGGSYGVDVRFSDGVAITGNTIEDTEETGVWVNESTETTEAGLGYTADIAITGNQLRRLGYRGVHVNCAARRVHVGGNQVVDPSTTAATREGIRADSSPDGVSIIGNTVRFSGTVNSPYGISVSSTVTNATIRGNSSTGSTAAYEANAVGSFLDIEDDGSPEGTYSAAIGSRYSRLDGGSTTTLYAKTSGTGNTGWTVVGSGGGGGGSSSSYFPGGW